MKRVLLSTKFLLLFAMFCLTTHSVMAFESVQFYFMVTAATAQTGAGKVYVSYQTNTPDAEDYADMSSDWAPITEMYIPDEDPVPTEATDGEMNLWAKPMVGYAFTGWTEQGSTDVLSTELKHTVSDLLVTSTDKNKPTTYNYVAHFKMLETIESGTYFIKNDALGTYVTNGQMKGSQATLEYTGVPFECTKQEDGTFTLKTPMGYLDESGNINASEASSWTIKHLGDSKFTITAGEKKLGADGVNVTLSADAQNTVWEFVYEADVYHNLKRANYNRLVDATYNVKHPGFESKLNDCWIATGSTNMDELDGERSGDFSVESKNATSFSVGQTISGMPAGVYDVQLNGFYRFNTTEDDTNQNAVSAHADNTEELNAYLDVNGTIQTLKSIADEEGQLPTTLAEAQAAFAKGLYVNTVRAVVESDGVLSISIKKDKQAGFDWTVFDNVRLNYLGNFPELSDDVVTMSSEEASKIMVGDRVFSVELPDGVLPTEESVEASIEIRDEDDWDVWEAVETDACEVETVDGKTSLRFTGFDIEWDKSYRVKVASGSLTYAGVLANTEEIYYRFDVPEEPEVNVEATYVEASKCVILTFPDCDEVDFGTNKENVTIDGEQVTIEYGQELNEIYIYKELAAGEHTIVLSAGSITLDDTENAKDITVTLNIEGKPVLAQVAVTQNEETKTYTITSDNEKLAVFKLVKNMDYLDEGKTPETALLEEIEGLSSVFFSEDDFTKGYLEFGAEFAPITIDPSQYTEVYEAGTEMFIIAAQIGWNVKEGKVTLMSNVSETITFTVPEAPAEVNVEATYVEASKCVILTFPDCDEVDFGTNKNNVTIDGEQVTIEYGQELNEMYIYKELAVGEHTIVLSAGSITLDGTANEKDITVTLNIESPSTGIQRVDNGTTTDGKRLEAGKIVIIKNGIKYSTSGARI